MAGNLVKVTTPLFRLSFANVWEPKQKMNSEKMEYSLSMLFPKDADLSRMKQLAWQACTKKFGEDVKKWPGNLRVDWKSYLSTSGKDGFPFRDGDTQPYDGYEGMISVRATSDVKVPVFDAQLNLIIVPDEVYSGCYCHASIGAFAWHHTQTNNRGVSFSLLALQKVKDGPPFRTVAGKEDFTPYEKAADDAGSYNWGDGEEQPF